MTEQWSGSLGPRKKGELLELSNQLGLSIDPSSTKPEILDALRAYIDAKEAILMEDRRFKGLYGRKAPARKGSAAPHDESDESSPNSGAMVTRKRRGTLQTIRRSTSPLKAQHSHRGVDVELPMTPSRIALPASPARLLSSAISRIRPDMGGVVENVNRKAEQLGARRDEALTSTKKFMSNSPNIATLSVIWELVVLLYTFIPTVTHEITFTVPGSSSPSSFALRYPPAAVFFSKDLYALVLPWAIPTLLLPFIFGSMISFRGSEGVDPVSSGIARLVCAVSSSWGVPDSLLNQKTRIISAATALSFAVAEALSQPAEQQRVQPKINRRLLMES